MLIVVIAVPAAAHSAPSRRATLPALPAAPRPTRSRPQRGRRPTSASGSARDCPADLRMRLVDRPEIADFVLVDDFSGAEHDACRSSTPIQTVKLDAERPTPDVTVSLSAEPGRRRSTRIYVHSVRFSQQDAAALLAAMWKAERQRRARGGADRSLKSPPIALARPQPCPPHRLRRVQGNCKVPRIKCPQTTFQKRVAAARAARPNLRGQGDRR